MPVVCIVIGSIPDADVIDGGVPVGEAFVLGVCCKDMGVHIGFLNRFGFRAHKPIGVWVMIDDRDENVSDVLVDGVVERYFVGVLLSAIAGVVVVEGEFDDV